MSREMYSENGDLNSFTVQIGRKGWIVKITNRGTGAKNEKFLVPYGRLPWKYDAKTPLDIKHNEIFTVGGLIADYALFRGDGVRELKEEQT